MSAGTLLELSIIFISRKGIEGPPLLDSFLASYKIAIIPFDQPAVVVGRQGCIDYGKKRSIAMPEDLKRALEVFEGRSLARATQ